MATYCARLSGRTRAKACIRGREVVRSNLTTVCLPSAPEMRPMETRREQIYATAGALFSRRGYAATSVRDIARELDLQGGSLYAHIDSKEDVLWAIVAGAAESFFAAARPIVAADLPATERLRALIAAHVGVVAGRAAQAAVFQQEWRHLS